MNSDENKNTLNISKINKAPSTPINKSLIDLFPYLFGNISNNKKDEENLEFNQIVKSIIKNQSSNILKGDDNLIEQMISKYANVKLDNIPLLTKVIMKIPENFGMLNDFGFHLPKLIDLNLEGSKIESISELGSSFKKLKKLNVSKCGLKDISGIICFQDLEYLDASFNELTDLLEIETCINIETLIINDNKISNEDNINFIFELPKLKQLKIKNNPVEQSKYLLTGYVDKKINIIP